MSMATLRLRSFMPRASPNLVDPVFESDMPNSREFERFATLLYRVIPPGPAARSERLRAGAEAPESGQVPVAQNVFMKATQMPADLIGRYPFGRSLLRSLCGRNFRS